MKITDFSNQDTAAACEWPNAWLMPEEEVQGKDLKLPNQMSPNVPATSDDLLDLGITYRKIGFDAFASPVIDADWDSSDDETDVSSAKSTKGYSYANIITLNPEHFPKCPASEIKRVFEGSCLHRKGEMCYVLVGSGFLDVRCSPDRWVRLNVKKGDLLTLPDEMYHRFTADEDEEDGDVQYFAGQPFWTPLVRIMLDSRMASN